MIQLYQIYNSLTMVSFPFMVYLMLKKNQTYHEGYIDGWLDKEREENEIS